MISTGTPFALILKKMNILVVAVLLSLMAVAVGQPSQECSAALEGISECALNNLNLFAAGLCATCIESLGNSQEVEDTESPGATCAQEGAALCSQVRQCDSCRGCFSEIDDAYFKCGGSNATMVTNSDIFDCVCPDGCRAGAGSLFFGSKC